MSVFGLALVLEPLSQASVRRGLPTFLVMLLAVPLLGIAALLLPMRVSQTVMQLRAGVTFGPEVTAPLVGFSLISVGATCFLWKLVHRMKSGV
jgi:hypothetical protein